MAKAINGFFVYTYHYDDDPQGGWQPLTDQERITILTALFKACGWEGDGNLEWMLVPPLFGDATSNRWFHIYHVKQSHRGTSWIASEYKLTVEDLTEEDDAKAAKGGR